MKKSESFLTNPKYKQVLQILLTSREPLSISEILKQIEKPNDKDIYRIIKPLLPIRDNPTLLVRWDKILSNDRWYKYQFLKRLDIVKARLGDTTKQGYPKYIEQDIDDGNIISYEKSADDKILSIYYGSKIIAKFNIEQTNFPTLEIYNREIDGERKKAYPLILKNKNNKIYLYIETFSKKPIKYLFASSIDDTSKSIYEYEKSFSNDNNYFNRPKFANFYDISELTHDRVNWKYRLLSSSKSILPDFMT